MCDTCGCGDADVVSVEVQERILAKNDRTATHNRDHFSKHGVICVNVMGSPGAGKTALLEATAARFGGSRRLAALTGDLATDNDAVRLQKAGIVSVPITTGTACHLDAEMVHHALHEIELDGVDYLFIENVGNLVCPAIYDLGQVANVVALSVTEGEDKPLKYPVMFRGADLVLITKCDLAQYLPDISIARIEDSIARVMAEPKTMVVSARPEFGIARWVDWLEEKKRSLAPAAAEVAAAGV